MSWPGADGLFNRTQEVRRPRYFVDSDLIETADEPFGVLAGTVQHRIVIERDIRAIAAHEITDQRRLAALTRIDDRKCLARWPGGRARRWEESWKGAGNSA